MQRPARLVIIEDQQIFRECLDVVLTDVDWLTVIDSIDGHEDALEKVQKLQPDIALIDSDLCDRAALELTRRIATECPRVKVLILGITSDYRDVQEFIEAGAKGYIVTSATLNELITAIRSLVDGEIALSPHVTYAMFAHLSHLACARRRRQVVESMKLTSREMEILQMIADGLSNKEIANQLCLSLYTVKNHVHQVLEKLQVQDRWQAVEYAQNQEWLK
ncbi:MAG TPA: response regulator transcription factor [Pyrinomonadaceae bacterium]